MLQESHKIPWDNKTPASVGSSTKILHESQNIKLFTGKVCGGLWLKSSVPKEMNKNINCVEINGNPSSFVQTSAISPSPDYPFQRSTDYTWKFQRIKTYFAVTKAGLGYFCDQGMKDNNKNLVWKIWHDITKAYTTRNRDQIWITLDECSQTSHSPYG